jgi:hypothetical protein
MSYWDEWSAWFNALLGDGSTDSPTGQPEPQPLKPRVLQVVYNPIIHSEGGRKLSELLGWNDADELAREFIADLRECSGGFLEYQVVKRMEVDAWPVKADGFRYDVDTFLRCWTVRRGFHDPDAVDYGAIVDEFGLLTRVDSREIDEVWLFASPYAGFYESIMVGPRAFWCNAPPMPRTADISRRFVIMGFNYERGVGPMLESFGHRVESHLKQTWSRKRREDNLWEQFILYDSIAPGQANCGWMHYAPNSLYDYDWGNPSVVPSNCDDWLYFPDFQGIVRQVDSREWGGGDMRAHHKWWFKHLPKARGRTQGISNNWWWYGVDPNAVP